MNRKNWTWSMLLAGVALATGSARAQTQDDWTRDFRIAMQVGWNIKANFTTSGQLGISGSQPGSAGGGNHIYDDGYVKVDQTRNALGQTSFWGYNNASQLSGQTLTYHASTSVDVPTTQTSASDAPYFGFDMAYGGTITYWSAARARVGWEFGFGLLPIKINDSQDLPGTFDLIVHQFSTSVPGSPIVVPQAPYNGGSSGIGPTIPDDATVLPSQTVPGVVTGTRTLDVMLYNLRLGPTLHWDLGPRWGVSVSAGPAFGIVNGDYKFNESNVLLTGGSVQNTGQFSGTEFVYGGYANALALFRLEQNGDIFLGVQYLGLTSAKFSNGGREATLNLGSGIYLTAGVNWAF